MLKAKSLLEYTSLFSPNEYEKNDKIILKYFQYIKRLRWKNCVALSVVSIENLKILKNYTYSRKTLTLAIICSKCRNLDEKKKKKIKEHESIEILQILFLFKKIISLKKWLKKRCNKLG